MLVGIVCVYFMLVFANGIDPGLRLTLTEDGLEYASKVAAESISKDIKNTRLDNISAETFGIQFQLTDLRVKDFKLSESKITFGKGNVLQWTSEEMKLEVNGAYQYKWRIISGRGDFEIKLSDMSVDVGIMTGINTDGKPTIKTSSCSGEIDNVRIRFYGMTSWVFNILSGVTKDTISKLLQNEVCKRVRQLIDWKAKQTLCSLKCKCRIPILLGTPHVSALSFTSSETYLPIPFFLVQIPLGDTYTLDYSLVSAPILTASESIDFEMKGEVFWTRNKTEVPFSPPKMATVTEDDKMAYLTISDYVFNSLTYQAYRYNMLVFNLSAKDLNGYEDLLNTTCIDDTCIGYLIPQIGIAFPNSKVEMNIKSVDAPLVSILDDGIGVLAAMEIMMFARTPDNTLNYLFKVFSILTTSLEIKMKNQMLYSSIENMGIITNVTNSAIGEIDIVALQLFVETIIKEVVKPTLDDVVDEVGFPLPSTDQLEFKGSHIEFIKNTILIGTDLKFISFDKRISKIFKYESKVKQSPKSLDV